MLIKLVWRMKFSSEKLQASNTSNCASISLLWAYQEFHLQNCEGSYLMAVGGI